jgi:hypothetical protein
LDILDYPDIYLDNPYAVQLHHWVSAVRRAVGLSFGFLVSRILASPLLLRSRPGLLFYLPEPRGSLADKKKIIPADTKIHSPGTNTRASIPSPPMLGPTAVSPNRSTTAYDASSTRLRASSRGRPWRAWPKGSEKKDAPGK